MVTFLKTHDKKAVLREVALLMLVVLISLIALPVAGVAVATLLTPLRRDLATRWPWLGALAGVLILSPNLYWQLANDWVSFAFYSKVEAGRFTASAWQQIQLQIMAQNPAAMPTTPPRPSPLPERHSPSGAGASPSSAVASCSRSPGPSGSGGRISPTSSSWKPGSPPSRRPSRWRSPLSTSSSTAAW